MKAPVKKTYQAIAPQPGFFAPPDFRTQPYGNTCLRIHVCVCTRLLHGQLQSAGTAGKRACTTMHIIMYDCSRDWHGGACSAFTGCADGCPVDGSRWRTPLAQRSWPRKVMPQRMLCCCQDERPQQPMLDFMPSLPRNSTMHSHKDGNNRPTGMSMHTNKVTIIQDDLPTHQ